MKFITGFIVGGLTVYSLFLTSAAYCAVKKLEKIENKTNERKES